MTRYTSDHAHIIERLLGHVRRGFVCVCVFILHRRAVLPVVQMPLETSMDEEYSCLYPLDLSANSGLYDI